MCWRKQVWSVKTIVFLLLNDAFECIKLYVVACKVSNTANHDLERVRNEPVSDLCTLSHHLIISLIVLNFYFSNVCNILLSLYKLKGEQLNCMYVRRKLVITYFLQNKDHRAIYYRMFVPCKIIDACMCLAIRRLWKLMGYGPARAFSWRDWENLQNLGHYSRS
jgi:hypothetical protein